MNNYKKSTLYAAILVASAAGNGALAQAPILEEVLVTATKRVVGMQDVPIALAVMSGATIDEAGLRELEDVAAYLPAVHVGESTGGTQIFIRGIGSGNNRGFEQSVGTFVDGVYFGRDRNSRAAFLDVERVEVLKGPQSTLFGKNTVAGAINITSRRPGDEFEGYIEGSYETEVEGFGVTAAISGPLTGTLRGRLVGKFYDDKGWMENQAPGGEDGPQQENRVVRGVLEWDATDNLSFFLKAEHGEFNVKGRSSKISLSSPTANALFGFGNDPDLGSSLGFNTQKSSSTFAGRPEVDKNKSDILQLTFDYQLANHNLRSITAYTDYEVDACSDSEGPLKFIDTCGSETHEQFTQEFILSSEFSGSVEYLAGLYYQQAELYADSNARMFPSGVLPLENFLFATLGLPLPSGSLDSEAIGTFKQTSETWSAFGQLTWHMTDRLSTTIGIRYSDDQKDVDKVQLVVAPGETVADPLRTLVMGPAGLNFRVPYDYSESRGEDHVTGGIQIQYDFNDDVMTYLSLSNGYKAGGFDVTNALDVSRDFEDESVVNVEVGAKMELWDNRARINMAIFNAKFGDLQVSSAESGTFTVTNAGESSVTGFELDFLVALTESITVNGALALLDAEYDDYQGAACTVGQRVSGECAAAGGVQDMSGTPLQFAPDVSGNIGVTYRAPLTNSTDLILSVDALYSDDILIGPDADRNTIQDSYWKMNARIAWQANDGTWVLALVGKNLTDETTFNWANDVPMSGAGFGFENAYYHHIEKPRTYEFQARYNF